jgi:uncharacterized OB-fold protein
MNDDGLRLLRCPACGQVPSFPRVACPSCFGPLEALSSSGRGRVRTYAVIRRTHQERFAAHLPIVMALIELEDGVELISTIVGENRLETAIGAPVAVARYGRWSPLVQFSLEGT